MAFITADTPESGPESTNEFIFFEEDDLKREMNFEINIHADNIKPVYTDRFQELRKIGEQALHKRQTGEGSEHYGCHIAVRLKPFMSWNHEYKMATISGRQYAILNWLDIGEKSGMAEEFLMEITREDQRLNSESPFGALDGPFVPSRSQRGQAPMIKVEHLETPSSSGEDLNPDVKPRSSRGSLRRLISRGDHHSED